MTKSITFLLVDDDTDDTALFQEILEEVNDTVSLHIAANGIEALKLLRTSGKILPDIIFLDLNMPLMDGKEFLVALKKDDAFKKIPVIMYTTSSMSKDIEDAMQHGALCFITKPTNLKELKNILSHIADNIHNNLEKALKTLSGLVATFIVC
jgi:CheY-like chemotaxis protein